MPTPEVNESILSTIKKMLYIEEDDESFDIDIMVHINTALAILSDLGVGPEDGLTIFDKNDTWDVLLSYSPYNLIKTYIYLKVRQYFDPPSTAALTESSANMIKELEWRIVQHSDRYGDIE